MLVISELRERLGDGDSVTARPSGEVVDTAMPGAVGRATLIVSAPTDALKTCDGRLITGSVDRDQVWAVEALALSGAILGRLEGELTLWELLGAVAEMGVEWEVVEAP